jgi:hypothetical protein
VRVRVIIDDKGNVTTIQRPRPGSRDLDAAPAGGPKTGITPAPGHKLQELDVPDDFEQIEDAAEFHSRLLPHLKRGA